MPSLLGSMDGEQDGGQQDDEGQGEDPAVPGLVRLTQGCEADAEEDDDDQERADVEPEAAHDSTCEGVSIELGAILRSS
jgi:hypothetical protein